LRGPWITEIETDDSVSRSAVPLKLAFGATGGPERRTEIVTLGSGREERNTPWAHARRRYDVGGAVSALDDLHELIAFFEARRGRLHGFRFRDFADWRSGAPSAAPAASDQAIGVGNGAQMAFQLIKTYGEGADAYQRPIRKPVSGSVLIAVNGAALSPGAYAVNHATGLVTLVSAPAAGHAVTAGYVFDTPVRFDSDRLEASLDAFSAGRLIQIALIELVL
jgi:uncharacterized protein (TIGR02217 family)